MSKMSEKVNADKYPCVDQEQATLDILTSKRYKPSTSTQLAIILYTDGSFAVVYRVCMWSRAHGASRDTDSARRLVPI